jgi:hypothetical protein
LPGDKAMEAAWATQSRDLSRGLTQVTSTGADLASRTLIQTIEPNFVSRFDQSRVFPRDGLHCLEHLSINKNDVEQASYRSAGWVTAVQ